MKRLACVSVLVLAAPAAADTLASADDPGTITEIERGVSELDLGALGVVTYHDEGDRSNTRVNMLFGTGYQYFVRTNVSIGGQVLFSHDRTSDTSSSRAVGGAASGTLHVRLGFGVFLRPTLMLGALFGSRELDTGSGSLVMRTSQTAFLTRLQLPVAYYPSRRVVLQAGPELDVSLGSVERGGTYTTLASGFSVGLGYVF